MIPFTFRLKKNTSCHTEGIVTYHNFTVVAEALIIQFLFAV